ncbi:MAG: hypothetical protein KDK70_09530 [Myxococcales bacterium]|nr:hypothetical protein [Myxococcales bacterium]
MDPRSVDTFIRERFADKVSLSVSEIFDADLTLGEVMMRSEALRNSVDLMEAFAAAANALKKAHGLRVRLPAFPLDTRVSVVMQAFTDQVAQKLVETRKVG